MKWLVWPLALTLALNGMGGSLVQNPTENPTAQTSKQERAAKIKAAKIKAEVVKRGVGGRARLKFRNGQQRKGRITRMDEDSFDFQMDPDKLDSLPGKQEPITILYVDVGKIRGPQTRAARIGVDVGEKVLFVALFTGLVLLAILKYNHEHKY